MEAKMKMLLGALFSFPFWADILRRSWTLDHLDHAKTKGIWTTKEENNSFTGWPSRMRKVTDRICLDGMDEIEGTLLQSWSKWRDSLRWSEEWPQRVSICLSIAKSGKSRLKRQDGVHWLRMMLSKRVKQRLLEMLFSPAPYSFECRWCIFICREAGAKSVVSSTNGRLSWQLVQM